MPQATVQSSVVAEAWFAWHSMHKSIVWFRQMAQLSTTMSIYEQYHVSDFQPTHDRNVPHAHSATAFHCTKRKKKSSKHTHTPKQPSG